MNVGLHYRIRGLCQETCQWVSFGISLSVAEALADLRWRETEVTGWEEREGFIWWTTVGAYSAVILEPRGI